MEKNLLDFIGKTPLLQLKNFAPDAKIFAKLESKNPGGSAKDRAAAAMILAAEKSGKIENGKIAEATSGNTGIALAWISRLKKYELFLTMPENFSAERKKILQFLGAKIFLTKKSDGMRGAVAAAQKIAAEKKAFLVNQFENPENANAHFCTTGPEIWQQMEKKIDVAIFGVGTGGTLTGAGKYLKMKNPAIKIFAVEPEKSAVLSGESSAAHQIEGIGAGFWPPLLPANLLDGIAKISEKSALAAVQNLAQKEGVSAGISSGAAAAAAQKIAKNFPQKKIVTIFPDSAEKYFSTKLFQNLTFE